VIIDVANVMGARADGWWNDRAGAAARLCGEVAALAGRIVAAGGLAPGELPGRTRAASAVGPPGTRVIPHWVPVLEGRARAAAAADPALNLIDSMTYVSMVLARGSGDDTIVSLAAELGKYCTVVTADRELRRRCELPGASVTGPRWLLGLL
jgi:hypothetical protein